ncbi:hypothetical protein ACVTZN_22415, partial [Klebsiella pneumoniae]
GGHGRRGLQSTLSFLDGKSLEPQDRRRRQSEGISKAKAEGKYRGRVADAQKHELIRTLRLVNGKSLRETARLAGVSKMTVIRVCSSADK